jgi:hypothetical protein
MTRLISVCVESVGLGRGGGRLELRQDDVAHEGTVVGSSDRL